MSARPDLARLDACALRGPFSMLTPDGAQLLLPAVELQQLSHPGGARELQLVVLASDAALGRSICRGHFRAVGVGRAVAAGRDADASPPSSERVALRLRPEVAQLLFAVCADVEELRSLLEEVGAGSLFRRTSSWSLVEARAPRIVGGPEAVGPNMGSGADP